ncbi:MAG: aminotransferase class I/II-fold pyridoxal phosphate-dependent enzyme [Oscillospiraceae bacterium]|nr:aminotransferase class I/II-fold pyridoxal phosphate-dependent enzyme [Oscillospiraceae bacterium]
MENNNIYSKLTKDQLSSEQKNLSAQYESYKSKSLTLNMTRGIPCKDQLDLSNDMLKIDMGEIDYLAKNMGDFRNYCSPGGLMGTFEARELFSDLMGADSVEEVMVGGNSSLAIMHDTMARSFMHGTTEESVAWHKLSGEDKAKFLCPVPGYDRHFSICEALGVEMINIKMNPDGPDMDAVERLANSDPSIKGIWCVPKYSNPEGITYSDEVVRRLANLSPAAKDFRIYWDNAYIVHDLSEEGDCLLNIFAELKKNKKEDMIYMFASTSKITFCGGGVAAICASEKNIKYLSSKAFVQMICPDKINQMRHVLFLKDTDGIKAQMARHRKIIRPKFDAVLDGLKKGLGETGLANWTSPNGGYFISLNVPCGCAKRTVELAAGLGLALTPAGATYPYKKDPEDKNIRLSPTFPTVGDLTLATEALCICAKLAYIEKIGE